MKALILGCSLKSSPEPSNTEQLADVLQHALRNEDVLTESLRVVDFAVLPGVVTDAGEGDEWPIIHGKITEADILVIASPTWLGQLSSVAKRVLERMDAMLSEEDQEGRPVAANKVAGVVVTGTSDGAHWVTAQIQSALIEIGFTVPGQSWTYWNKGPGPGESYSETNEGHDWSEKTAVSAAHNLVDVARALAQTPLRLPSN